MEADESARLDGSALSEVLGPLLRQTVDAMQAARDGMRRLGEADPDVWQYATGLVGIALHKAMLLERERLLALAKKRADYEASAAAHHAGRWHEAHEHHLARHAAMRDLIDALKGPNAELSR